MKLSVGCGEAEQRHWKGDARVTPEKNLKEAQEGRTSENKGEKLKHRIWEEGGTTGHGES
jgi:hypothetical protein